MDFKICIIIYFTTCCVLQVNAETEISEISFEVKEDVNNSQWDVVPLNAMSEDVRRAYIPFLRTSIFHIDTAFILMEETPAIITVSNIQQKNGSDGIVNVKVLDMKTMDEIPTAPVKCHRGNPRKCSVQVNETITYNTSRLWKLIFLRAGTKNPEVTKTIHLHIRRITDTNILGISYKIKMVKETKTWSFPIPLEIPKLWIQEFDAYGCVLYNNIIDVKLYCANGNAMDNYYKINNTKSYNFTSPKTIKVYEPILLHNITKRDDKSYVDCIEKTIDDLKIAGVFFLYNRNKGDCKGKNCLIPQNCNELVYNNSNRELNDASHEIRSAKLKTIDTGEIQACIIWKWIAITAIAFWLLYLLIVLKKFCKCKCTSEETPRDTYAYVYDHRS